LQSHKEQLKQLSDELATVHQQASDERDELRRQDQAGYVRSTQAGMLLDTDKLAFFIQIERNTAREGDKRVTLALGR
jgi:hypothetical protein